MIEVEVWKGTRARECSMCVCERETKCLCVLLEPAQQVISVCMVHLLIP